MAIRLKSLRPAVGTYGTVGAGGIIEVDDAKAAELIKTKRFVKATKEDVAAAQARQADMLAVPAGVKEWPQVVGVVDGDTDSTAISTDQVDEKTDQVDEKAESVSVDVIAIPDADTVDVTTPADDDAKPARLAKRRRSDHAV